MRRDETASKCFVQLVGNRKLAGDKALELPSLPVSELMLFQNYAGLRGWTRTGRPCPAFHGMRKPSTCGFRYIPGMVVGSGSNVVDGPVSWRRPCREPDPRRSEVGKQTAAGKCCHEKENRPDILPELLKNLVGPPGFEPRTQGL